MVKKPSSSGLIIKMCYVLDTSLIHTFGSGYFYSFRCCRGCLLFIIVSQNEISTK